MGVEKVTKHKDQHSQAETMLLNLLVRVNLVFFVTLLIKVTMR